jgi:hypothetical protein
MIYTGRDPIGAIKFLKLTKAVRVRKRLIYLVVEKFSKP